MTQPQSATASPCGIDQWDGCYDDGWKGLLWEDKEAGESAFSHPAKFSRGLIFRIIEHALACDLIQPGGVVVDPFGGVALGALPCLMAGLSWVGCELEPRFVEMGRNNIELWNSRFAGMPKWTGTAQLLQGDSRRLAEVVAAAGLVVSSPPYAESIDPRRPAEIEKDRQHRLKNGRNPDSGGSLPMRGYGSTPGQLGAMIVGSPPYADGCTHTGSDDPAKRGGILTSDPKRAGDVNLTGSYGQSEGQLGAMVVGSPPYEGSGMDRNDKNGVRVGLNRQVVRKNRAENIAPDEVARSISYGASPGQLGNDTGETFWTAARAIVEQCALLLPTGGAAVWVVKNYIKSGREVDFTGQWAALCEACGFEMVHVHRAMLVKRRGAQAGFDGEMVSKDVSRKSFFRRLAERNGLPAIDWETVLCTVKR